MANIVENVKNGNLVKGPLANGRVGEFLSEMVDNHVDNETAKTAVKTLGKILAAPVDIAADLLKGVANAPNSISELDKTAQGDSVAENVGNIIGTAASVAGGGNFLANRAVASGINSGDAFVNLFDPAFKNDNKPMPKKEEEDEDEVENDDENVLNMQPHNPAAQDGLLNIAGRNMFAEEGDDEDEDLASGAINRPGLSRI